MNTSVELGRLLRGWRARTRPADVGFPAVSESRRTPGLRREEVAVLAGVSVDYLQRLEQGRAHPSPTVLRALARALRLETSEFEAASDLAGHARPGRSMVAQHMGPSVLRLLDRLGDVPVAVFDAGWTMLDHNQMWAALMGDTRRVAGRPANLVWRYFTGDPHRIVHSDPAEFESAIVADLRGTLARYPADRPLSEMVRALRDGHPRFRELWDAATVSKLASERKAVVHPDVGTVELDCDVLSVHGMDLRVIVFTAGKGSEAAEKLDLLRVIGTQDMTPELPHAIGN